MITYIELIDKAVGDTPYGEFIVKHLKGYPTIEDGLKEIIGVVTAYDHRFGNLSDELKSIPNAEKIEITKKALKALEEFEKTNAIKN